MQTVIATPTTPQDAKKVLKEFTDFLQFEGMSSKTVKNYVADIAEFISITNSPSHHENAL